MDSQQLKEIVDGEVTLESVSASRRNLVDLLALRAGNLLFRVRLLGELFETLFAVGVETR